MPVSYQQTIFVYGSFTQGLIHNAKIEKYVSVRQPAYVLAHAYLLDVGYPALIAADAKPSLSPKPIAGELINVDAPELVHKIMDDFHGIHNGQPEKGLHFKESVQANTSAGTVSAGIYYLNPTKLPKSAQHIVNGDWQAAFKSASRVQDLLTQDQIQYMRKLAAIKGRQSHSYDLETARQLMKLEIVVDKGRRLALTRLGKDVLRYLPDDDT